LAKKYKLSVGNPSKGNQSEDLPVNDFFDFLCVRAKKAGKKMDSSLKQDWLKKYPQLIDWKCRKEDQAATVHCEIKLALDCLNRRRTGKVVIGVSKQPCYCCESWFNGINHKAKNIKFSLALGHKKVYSGWSLTGIEEGDKKAIAKVWEVVDAVAEEVSHIESQDLIPGYPLEVGNKATEFAVAEMAKLHEIASNFEIMDGCTQTVMGSDSIGVIHFYLPV
jgi:OTT_1508-like deaminase